MCAPDLIERIAALNAIEGIESLTMTTNGTRLPGRAAEVRAAGVSRLNISCDALDAETFHRINGGNVDELFAGISSAREVFDDIRLNVVMLRGVNDANPGEFAAFARETGATLRFLELMPTTRDRTHDLFIPARVVRERLESSIPLVPDAPEDDAETAAWYRAEVTGQRIGFIAPVSRPFCLSCNRMRLTADGSVLPCLHSEISVSIRDVIRGGCDDAEIARCFLRAARRKPRMHELSGDVPRTACRMYVCGG